MANRALDANERARLQVLRAATKPNAPAYGAVPSVVVAAKERYQVQVWTNDIARDLIGAGWYAPASLASTLEQLKDWGAVTCAQDTSRVAHLEDFKRRRERGSSPPRATPPMTASCGCSAPPNSQVRSSGPCSGTYAKTPMRSRRQSMPPTRPLQACACAASTEHFATWRQAQATSTPPWPSSAERPSSRPSGSSPTSTCSSIPPAVPRRLVPVRSLIAVRVNHRGTLPLPARRAGPKFRRLSGLIWPLTSTDRRGDLTQCSQ